MFLFKKSKAKHYLLIGLVLLLAVSAGCRKKPTYEGGHIALFYDADKWELSYQKTEPYPTFHLQYDENEITIMLAENDGSIVESFYNDTVSLYRTFAEITSKSITDEWDSKARLYYEDFLTYGTDSETMITYAKKQDNMLIVGLAEIMTQESGEENKELTEEILEILSSMEYSEQTEIGGLSEKEELEYIRYMNDRLQMLVSFNPASEEVETEESDEAESEILDPAQMEAVSDEELSVLQYIKKMEIDDFYGDHSKYSVYAPKDNTYENGYLYWSGHGLTFSASALNLDTTSYMYEYLSNIVEYTTCDWQEAMGYQDIEISEVMKNGDDRYLIATAMAEDFYGTSFQVKEIFYMDMQSVGAGVFWDLDLHEMNVDEETDTIIDELAKCYHVDMNVMKTDGEWVKANAERIERDQDIYEPREGDNVLEPVDGYQYMGITTLSDGSGAASCPVMVPMGSSTIIRDNHVYSHLHGVITSADISRIFQSNFMLEAKGTSDRRYHTCENDTENKRNIWKSELIPLSGYDEAYYVEITCEEKNTLTEEYESQARIYYYIKIDESYYLEYSITLLSGEYDNSTNTVIKELETAYGDEKPEITLEEAAPTEKPITMSQLIGNSGNDSDSSADEEKALPETVLWFNATYAPLTYSNAGNWRLVGGLKPTESNGELVRLLLRRDWGIEDRDSALETVERLKENGHRKKCRDCMEELSRMELLELEEEDFFQELTDSGIKDYLFRYVIAYYMYREGTDADYIAAWDLCRVNQLYGDFYICGYMSYEEAMEASYDNSLILQEMYSSWEEMVNAYMLGYQFWKNDPALSEDSPTLERYRYYEMLLQLNDGPYTLDWNMELEKSW